MSDDPMDDADIEKAGGQIYSWYGLLIGTYLATASNDEVRRFICLDMATEGLPGKEAVKAAAEYERFLKGNALKAVEDK